MDKVKEISNILDKDIDPTTALNILISAVQVAFEKSNFNDLDKALIVKSLECFEKKVSLGKNFLIKVK
jgi:hypothetical protein